VYLRMSTTENQMRSDVWADGMMLLLKWAEYAHGRFVLPHLFHVVLEPIKA
jgi:hypothetical protein